MKRFGRFELDTYDEDHVQLRCDHGNGDPGAYEIPWMTREDVTDLIHGLQQMLGRVDENLARLARMRRAG